MNHAITEADLQARLTAAGVVDRASLEQALAADPELERAYNSFAEASFQQIMQDLIQQFKAVTDTQALAAFWEHVPSELEDTFISIVEQMVAQAEQDALNPEVIEGLRKRLEDIHQLQANQKAMAELLQQFLLVEDNQALVAFWQQVPSDLEETFTSTVEQIIAEAQQDGEHELAAGLRQRLEDIAHLQANQTAMAELFQQFVAVEDDQDLIAFWQQVPSDIEDSFISTVEQIIVQAQQDGYDPEAIEGLSYNLETIRQLQAKQTAMAILLQQFESVADTEDLSAFWQQVPSELHQSFLSTLEEIIEQAERDGEQEFAEGLRERLVDLHQLLKTG